MSGRARQLAFAGLAACLLLAPAARADDGKKAQDAFLRATKEFKDGDFRAAATDFEEAYRLKPHHSPLWNAARSWARAGENVRAANLYVKYLREAPAGTKDRDTATVALTELSAKLGKVVARANGPTDLKVDDVASDPDGVYVTPGEHVVSGVYEGKPVNKSVTLAAGQTLSVTLEPPAPPPPPPPAKVVEVAKPPPPPEGLRLPWVVVAVGGALTLGAGGFTVWSGLDSQSKRSDYRERFAAGTATEDELSSGRATQTRTNVGLAITAGLAALTGISAFFVDWHGPKPAVGGRSALTVQPTFGGLSIRYDR